MTRNETLQYINLAHFFDHFFLLIFPTAALAIAPAWHMTYAQVLLYGTPLFGMFAIGTLPAGWLGDRVDRTNLIILFYLGSGASSLFIALSNGPLPLMAGLGFLGLFAAIYHPVGLAHITDIGHRTGRALAINGIFGNIGLAGAAVTTGILAQKISWQAAFALPGALSIVIGLGLLVRTWQHRKSTAAHQNIKSDSLIQSSRRSQFIVFGVVCAAALFDGLVFNAVTISLPKYFDERLISVAGNLTWIGASTGAIFAIAAFAQLPVGELLDRFGAKSILTILLSGQIILMLMLSQATNWLALILSLLLVTLMFAKIPITSWLLSRYIKSNLRSRAMSVEYTLSLGMGSGHNPVDCGSSQHRLRVSVSVHSACRIRQCCTGGRLFFTKTPRETRPPYPPSPCFLSNR